MGAIFFKFWRHAFFFIGIATILFCYTSMPENVAVGHNEWGKPIEFISLQSFFYLAAGLFVGSSLLFSALRDQLTKVNFARIWPNSQWANNPAALKKLLGSWIDAFMAILNTYLVFALLGLYNINSTPEQRLDFNYNWLLLLGAALLLLVIFALPLLLLYTSPPRETDL